MQSGIRALAACKVHASYSSLPYPAGSVLESIIQEGSDVTSVTLRSAMRCNYDEFCRPEESRSARLCTELW